MKFVDFFSFFMCHLSVWIRIHSPDRKHCCWFIFMLAWDNLITDESRMKRQFFHVRLPVGFVDIFTKEVEQRLPLLFRTVLASKRKRYFFFKVWCHFRHSFYLFCIFLRYIHKYNINPRVELLRLGIFLSWG
jgi:hypothetical protein